MSEGKLVILFHYTEALTLVCTAPEVTWVIQNSYFDAFRYVVAAPPPLNVFMLFDLKAEHLLSLS